MLLSHFEAEIINMKVIISRDRYPLGDTLCMDISLLPSALIVIICTEKPKIFPLRAIQSSRTV